MYCKKINFIVTLFKIKCILLLSPLLLLLLSKLLVFITRTIRYFSVEKTIFVYFYLEVFVVKLHIWSKYSCVYLHPKRRKIPQKRISVFLQRDAILFPSGFSKWCRYGSRCCDVCWLPTQDRTDRNQSALACHQYESSGCQLCCVLILEQRKQYRTMLLWTTLTRKNTLVCRVAWIKKTVFFN